VNKVLCFVNGVACSACSACSAKQNKRSRAYTNSSFARVHVVK